MVGVVAALLLTASPDLNLDLRVRSELRVSQLAPDQITSVSRTSAEVQPLAALALESREWRLRLTYAPRLWMPDLHLARLDVDHQVDIRGEVNPLPTMSLALTGTAQRGLIDPLTDMWTSIAPGRQASTIAPGTSTTTVNAYEPLQYQSFRGAVDGLYRMGPASGISGSAFAGYSSGDAAHRTILPPQRSLGASLGWDKEVDARDRLRAQAHVNVVRTYNGGIDPTINAAYPDTETGYVWADATWRHRFSPIVTAGLGVGTSYVRETSQYANPINGWAPVVEVGLDLASDRPGPSLRTVVRYAPEVDRVTGRTRQAMNGATVYDVPFSLETSITAGIAASALIPAATQLSARHVYDDPASVSFEFRVSRRFGDAFVIGAGARTRRQTVVSQVNAYTGEVTRQQPNYMETTGFLSLDWDIVHRTRGAPPVGAR